MRNKKHCADCVYARYKVECKPFHIFCNLNNEYKNVNENCINYLESKVDSQIVEAFGQKLGMSEQEVINQIERIAKNLEEMKEIAGVKEENRDCERCRYLAFEYVNNICVECVNGINHPHFEPKGDADDQAIQAIKRSE